MSTDPISRYNSNGFDYCTHHTDTYDFIKPKPADFRGRYVVITGASKGIGRSTALSYAQAGAAGIAVAARSSLASLADEIRQVAESESLSAPKVVTLKLDVRDHAQALACGEEVKSQFGGRLDALICNAGVIEPNAKLLDQKVDDWRATLETNTLGVFNCLQAFVPTMLADAQSLKTVVGITSIGANYLVDGYSCYQPQKLALCRLMEQLMVEYGGEKDGGLLAYSLHPGSVPTDMGLSLPEEILPIMIDKPELPADTLVWLTKERREWLAGRYISANWEIFWRKGQR